MVVKFGHHQCLHYHFCSVDVEKVADFLGVLCDDKSASG